MASSDYSARHLSVLEGLEAVRKRPGMYIGSTDSRGLMHCLWEIIDNSVDEALGGNGDEISVVLHKDNSVEVRDRARGIPVDIEPKTGLSGVEVVFTKLHAGGKFGSGSYAASGGLHGVGASVVNALSERLDVEVDRDCKTWAMSFHRGEPGIFSDSTGGPRADAVFTPFENKSELRVTGKVARGVTGTRIRYWADPQIFSRGTAFQTDELATRARQTAFLVRGLGIAITDDRGPEQSTELFRFDGGIGEYVDFLAPDTALTETWRMTGSGSFSETVPVLDDKGHMVATELERECEVDIALRWGTGYETVFRSYVNIIATPKGGTHQSGFEAGMLRFLRSQVEQNARRLKVATGANSTEKIEKDDILAGLTAVLTVRLPEPQFEGQTKAKLGNSEVEGIVNSIMGEGLTQFLEENPAVGKRIIDKALTAQRARDAARKAADLIKRQSSLENSNLPGKLTAPSATPRSASCFWSRAIAQGGRQNRAGTGAIRRFCRFGARSSTPARPRSATRAATTPGSSSFSATRVTTSRRSD